MEATLDGATDGMADMVNASIEEQPAALSDGEFVIPADVVSHLVMATPMLEQTYYMA